MGQGLIQWQTIAFTKSSQSLNIKREATCLRAYPSAGEFNFHRGLGISLEKGNWQSTFFISSQKISTNRERDSISKEDFFSSFQTNGYHRTPAELADRNNEQQFAAVGNIKFTRRRFTIGMNMIHFQYGRPYKKTGLPYNLNSWKGNQLTDFSFDYQYTQGNLHLFGELGTDLNLLKAFMQAALISFSENLEMSFLYRNISPAFQSLCSDSFTENGIPNIEEGLYAGLRFKPGHGIQADLYYDLFQFPWLKYRIDGPSQGRDFFAQIIFRPVKSCKLQTFYKNELKMANTNFSAFGTNALAAPCRQRWRIEIGYVIYNSLEFGSRMEFVWLKQAGYPQQKGFLDMAGFSFHQNSFSGNLSASFFETDGYDTRIYIYESDLLYNYSLPAYFERGLHYHINLRKDFNNLFRQANIFV